MVSMACPHSALNSPCEWPAISARSVAAASGVRASYRCMSRVNMRMWHPTVPCVSGHLPHRSTWTSTRNDTNITSLQNHNGMDGIHTYLGIYSAAIIAWSVLVSLKADLCSAAVIALMYVIWYIARHDNGTQLYYIQINILENRQSETRKLLKTNEWEIYLFSIWAVIIMLVRKSSRVYKCRIKNRTGNQTNFNDFSVFIFKYALAKHRWTCDSSCDRLMHITCNHTLRADSRFAPSQWETFLKTSLTGWAQT